MDSASVFFTHFIFLFFFIFHDVECFELHFNITDWVCPPITDHMSPCCLSNSCIDLVNGGHKCPDPQFVLCEFITHCLSTSLLTDYTVSPESQSYSQEAICSDLK